VATEGSCRPEGAAGEEAAQQILGNPQLDRGCGGGGGSQARLDLICVGLSLSRADGRGAVLCALALNANGGTGGVSRCEGGSRPRALYAPRPGGADESHHRTAGDCWPYSAAWRARNSPLSRSSDLSTPERSQDRRRPHLGRSRSAIDPESVETKRGNEAQGMLPQGMGHDIAGDGNR